MTSRSVVASDNGVQRVQLLALNSDTAPSLLLVNTGAQQPDPRHVLPPTPLDEKSIFDLNKKKALGQPTARPATIIED